MIVVEIFGYFRPEFFWPFNSSPIVFSFIVLKIHIQENGSKGTKSLIPNSLRSCAIVHWMCVCRVFFVSNGIFEWFNKNFVLSMFVVLEGPEAWRELLCTVGSWDWIRSTSRWLDPFSPWTGFLGSLTGAGEWWTPDELVRLSRAFRGIRPFPRWSWPRLSQDPCPTKTFE